MGLTQGEREWYQKVTNCSGQCCEPHIVDIWTVCKCVFTWTRPGVTVQMDRATGVWCRGREQVRWGIPGQSRPTWVAPLSRWWVDRPVHWMTATFLRADPTGQYHYIWGGGNLRKQNRWHVRPEEYLQKEIWQYLWPQYLNAMTLIVK